MNHFYFRDTNSPKHLNLKIEAVKKETIGGLYNKGIRSVTIIDSQVADEYHISISKSNRLGLSGICFFNHKPSYQAAFDAGSSKLLTEVINDIAGGKII